MYIGLESVIGTMNMGVLGAACWRLLLFLPLRPPPLLPLPLPLVEAVEAEATAATGWKSEKMALFSGWQGRSAVEDATL